MTKDLLSRYDPPEAAAKADLPELLVWAVALEGKTDAARFDALGLERRAFNVWNFADADPRFGPRARIVADSPPNRTAAPLRARRRPSRSGMPAPLRERSQAGWGPAGRVGPCDP